MWVYGHMSFSIWSVCAWLCAGKTLYTNGLFTFVAAVGTQRSILTIPSPLQSNCGLTFVCVCVHVSRLCLTTTRFTTDGGWQTWATCTHRLDYQWTPPTHRQRRGQAVFPFECSAKPQATITLVPVCLTAAEMERCVFTAPGAAGWWCATAGVWHRGVGFTRYSLNPIVCLNNWRRTQGSFKQDFVTVS